MLYMFKTFVSLLSGHASYVYFFSLHVSVDYVPIIRRNNCLCDTWYLLFCVDDFLVCRVEYQSSIQNNNYQVSHKYSCFS